MPRYADHEQRRHQFADAAVSIAGRKGLDAVTVAGVAAEARVSVGLVQHYFPSKRELMVQAHARVLEHLTQRVGEMVARREREGASIRVMVIDGLSQLLPLDSQSRTEVILRAQFQGRAVLDPELAEASARTRDAVRQRLEQAVVNGRLCGETADGAVPADAGWSLWCLSDGLAKAMLSDPGVPAPSLLADAVTLVFPHPCRGS